jgi:CHASE2 domain-containing sensor protein/signal transduction histidine kinase
MSSTRRWGYTGVLLSASVALGVWILHQAGWLAAWDGLFYDRLHSWTAGWREPRPKVLMVPLQRENAFPGADAVKALELIEALQPHLVVFNFVPARASGEFFQRAAVLRNVVFGRELRPDPENPDELQLEPWPPEARDLDLPWGVVHLAPSVKGVYREQHAWVTTGTNHFPTLETRTAAMVELALVRPADNGTFLVSFAGGKGRIPNISLSRVMAGELVPEMVRGKVVLVGRSDSFLGLETPVTSGGETMSFLEFQGNVLQTLLDGTPLRPMSSQGVLLFLAGLGVVTALIYQRVSSVASLRLFPAALVLCGAAAWGATVFSRLWVPLGALVVAQTGQFALMLVLKARMANLALNEMRLHALNQIKERFCPADTRLTPEYWDQLGSMLRQTLDVERMVFFERVRGTPELREQRAFNCAFDDVREKARRLDVLVFSEALAKGGPVRVSGFFAPRQAPEEEYLCPLVFSGEVFGIWGVTINPAKAASIPQFETALNRFSQQIARLLFHNKQAGAKRTLAARLKAWFVAEKEDETYQELKSTADLLEQYYDILEGVFSQIGAATVIYDFFGRVLKANEESLNLLRPENFSPDRATALEFLRLATGRDDMEVRQLLRSVLLDHTPTSMPVRLPSQPDRHFLLRLYPLSEQKRAYSAAEGTNVRGMVCELIETTSLATLASLKGLVADRLGVELRDHLAAIELSASLLEGDALPASERQMMLDVIHQKTDVCVHVISECQKYLGRDVEAHTIHCFPVDSLELLNEAWAEVAQKAAERRVRLKMQQPRLMAQVLAATTDLARLFSAVLELLVKDAAENTALSIEVEDVSSVSTFRFCNCGFGIPNERLQEILTAPEAPASEEFQVLRKATGWARNWGGSIEISSDVGKGYCVTLRLRQFQLAPASAAADHGAPANSPGQQTAPKPLDA